MLSSTHGYLIIVVLILSATNVASQNPTYIRGCYYNDWVDYDDGAYGAQFYKSGLCTHIFYFLPVWSVNNMYIYGAPVDQDKYQQRLMDLRTKQPDLKVLFSMASWTWDMESRAGDLSHAISTVELRQALINSSLAYVKQLGFDGFDLYIWRSIAPQDKNNFASLVQEMSTIYHNNGLLLTGAVSAIPSVIDSGYDVPTMARYLDFVNVITFDLHKYSEPKTGYCSALYGRDGDTLSVSSGAEYWVNKGFPKNKLLIGFSAFGTVWTMQNRSAYSVGSPGSPGTIFVNNQDRAGNLFNSEICQLLVTNPDASVYFDSVQQASYLVIKDQWISYDDSRSYNSKLNWLMEQGYGGAFVFSLEQDDFTGGQCSLNNGTSYPLIQLIAAALNKSQTNTTTTTSMTTSTTTLAPITNPSIDCTVQKLYPDPDDCHSYYSCNDGMAYHMHCPDNLVFNFDLQRCDYTGQPCT